MGGELLELAARVEAATGPDRELDWAIADAVGFKGSIHKRTIEPFYTKSLDAAMTLVPEGWRVSDFTQWENESGAWSIMLLRVGHKHQAKDADAKTGPLAICAAALKARKSDQ